MLLEFIQAVWKLYKGLSLGELQCVEVEGSHGMLLYP